jgi:short-subunit dehydrogenase
MTQGLALVTGASSGIGNALAWELAERGFELVLSAHEPITGFGSAETVIADLTSPDGVETLYDHVRGRPLAVAALNAGITARSDDLERELALVDLNVRSTVHLARLITNDMTRGRVLLTASIVDVMPGPHQATYNASKAFIAAFGLALRTELQPDISVTVLEPGPTETPIFARAGQLDTLLGSVIPKDDPEDVARQAVDALLAGRQKVVAASITAKATHMAARVIPDAITARLNALVTKPHSG